MQTEEDKGTPGYFLYPRSVLKVSSALVASLVKHAQLGTVYVTTMHPQINVAR